MTVIFEIRNYKLEIQNMLLRIYLKMSLLNK